MPTIISTLMFATCVALSTACSKDAFEACTMDARPSWMRVSNNNYGIEMSEVRCDTAMTSMIRCFRKQNVDNCPAEDLYKRMFATMQAICDGCSAVTVDNLSTKLNKKCKALKDKVPPATSSCNDNMRALIKCVDMLDTVQTCKGAPIVDAYLKFEMYCKEPSKLVQPLTGSGNNATPKLIILIYAAVIATLKTVLY